MSDPGNIIPGSGATSDALNVEGREHSRTAPVIPLGHKSYDGEQKPGRHQTSHTHDNVPR